MLLVFERSVARELKLKVLGPQAEKASDFALEFP